MNKKRCDWSNTESTRGSLVEWYCKGCGRSGYGSQGNPPKNCIGSSIGSLNSGQIKTGYKSRISKLVSGNEGFCVFLFGLLIFIMNNASERLFNVREEEFVSSFAFMIMAVGLIFQFFPKEKLRNFFTYEVGQKLPWYKKLFYVVFVVLPVPLVAAIIVLMAALAFVTR